MLTVNELVAVVVKIPLVSVSTPETVAAVDKDTPPEVLAISKLAKGVLFVPPIVCAAPPLKRIRRLLVLNTVLVEFSVQLPPTYKLPVDWLPNEKLPLILTSFSTVKIPLVEGLL